MPSMPEFVYAALLYKDGKSPENPESKDFVEGTATEDGKLNFSFQKPDDTNGTFTLEIFAFKTGTSAANFSRANALLSGSKDKCAIEGDKINVSEPIALSVNSSSEVKGTVSLKINVPDGCSLSISETNEDGTTIAESDAHFTVTDTSPGFIITQVGEGISAGAYPVTFTVKKGDEIVHIFSEYINVINGLCTNTWWNGEKSSEVKDVASSIAKTVYVRGSGGWYESSDYKDSATASDSNSGSFLSPLASIQKAIDKIIAINDGASAYTIYVDGKLTQSAVASENGMVDFSALSQNLTLTIKALSSKATLDGGAVFNADGNITNAGIGKRVIYAKPASGKLNLTLENLVITGGNASDNGGGVYFSSMDGSLTMNGGEISGNKAAAGGGMYDDSGKFTMTAGTIGGNTATGYGGGIYFTASNTLKISGSATISGNKAKDGGGIAKTDHGFIEMDGGEISGNTATGTGGGIYSNSGGSVKISGGTISGNKATSNGGGIYNCSAYGVTISGDAIIKKNTTGSSGGGIYINSGSLDVKGGEISGNVANSDGGGIYFSSTAHSFEISGGMIGGASDSDKNTAKNGGGVYVYAKNPKMSGGTISGNTASENGGGIYVNVTGTFTMKDGAISGNTANGNDAKKGGGGVYVASGAFAMSDGTVNGNTATNGNGAYLAAKGKLNMSGEAQFAESDNVYLYANGTDIPTVCVAGDLNSSSPVVATITPSDYTAGRQVLSASTDMTIDDTICDKFAVTPQDDGTEWKIAPDGAKGVLMPDSALYVSFGGDDTAGDGTKAKPFATLQKAFDTIKDRNDSTASYTICISGTVVGGCEIRETSAANVLITGTSADTDILDGGGASYVFRTFSPFSIEIKNVKITNGSYCISVNSSNATVTLGSGAEVYVTDRTGINAVAGTFILDGGAILDDGAGMSEHPVIFSGKKFIMKSGTIEGRRVGSGGCVFINDSDGEFIMEGGTISGGTATEYGGGGVFINSGKFTMRGGTISGCQSTTTNTSYGGGGVYVNGSNCYFTMSGGEITGNTATTSGGGVYVDNNGTFTMEGGTISGNTATTSGGGVYGKTDDTFTQGGEISGNTPDNVYTP